MNNRLTQPFATIHNEFIALIQPFQTAIYRRLRNLLQSGKARSYIFPFVDYEEEVDHFSSLRIEKNHDPLGDSEIILFTNYQYIYKLEDLSLSQLLQLSWQLSTHYSGRAKLITESIVNGKTTKKNTTYQLVDEAYQHMRKLAIQYTKIEHPIARINWEGVDLTIIYGPNNQNLSTIKYSIEPFYGKDSDKFCIEPPNTTNQAVAYLNIQQYADLEHSLNTILSAPITEYCLN